MLLRVRRRLLDECGVSIALEAPIECRGVQLELTRDCFQSWLAEIANVVLGNLRLEDSVMKRPEVLLIRCALRGRSGPDRLLPEKREVTINELDLAFRNKTVLDLAPLTKGEITTAGSLQVTVLDDGCRRVGRAQPVVCSAS